MSRVVFAVAAWLACGVAQAQDFSAVQLKPGQLVRVTDDSGSRVSGQVVSLSREAIRIGSQEFSAARVAKIEKRGDTLWNGLWIGAAVGVFLPLLPTEACLNQSDAGCIASGIISGALMGVAIDALHRGYTTVYRGSPHKTIALAPRVGQHTQSVALSLRF